MTTSTVAFRRKTTFMTSTLSLRARNRQEQNRMSKAETASIDKAAMTFTKRMPTVGIADTSRNRGETRAPLASSTRDGRVPSTATTRSGAPSSIRGRGTSVGTASPTTTRSGASIRSRRTKTELLMATTSGPSSRMAKAENMTLSSISSKRIGTGRRQTLRGEPSARPSSASTSLARIRPSMRRIAPTRRLKCATAGKLS
mmetsp:Transcript_7229/g.10117  ORF Transcript_7229/g.10117 Transcript_7229/m.10117 type:complete len:200 (-) Transcript_7229:380-979(-)